MVRIRRAGRDVAEVPADVGICGVAPGDLVAHEVAAVVSARLQIVGAAERRMTWCLYQGTHDS